MYIMPIMYIKCPLCMRLTVYPCINFMLNSVGHLCVLCTFVYILITPGRLITVLDLASIF